MKFNKKITSLFAALALSATFMVGCGTTDGDKDDNNTPVAEDNNEVEGFSGASISDKPEELVEALGANGSWIFAATGDITVDEEIVVDGTFYNKNDGENVYRKLALYDQDDAKNVTANHTLTANGGMVIKSPNFRIQNGTVVGDIIVEAEGFNLYGTKVEGNIIFANEEFQDSFLMEEGAEVSGETKLAE